MPRYIDAEKIKYTNFTYGIVFTTRLDNITFKEDIDAIPTADVATVRHGHWVLHERAEEWGGLLIPNFECSNCHLYLRSDGAGNYCPNCGAKMDEEVKQ